MQPPFLDLSFYVGLPNVQAALVSAGFPGSGTSLFGVSELPSEVLISGGCILIRTEGEAFCGPMRRDTARMYRLGRRVQEVFASAMDRIDCLYGAVLVEYALEDPAELRRDPRSLAFQNFYLSRRRLPSMCISNVLAAAPPNTFIEERTGGVYLSTSEEFNPAGLNLDRSVAQEFSIRVAREIGNSIV